MHNSWLYLVLAIICEVAGTTSMKLSHGFSRWTPSILMFALYMISLFFLTLSMKELSLSAVYAIWSGLGTALISLVGILLFKESVSPIKLVSIGLIILGVIGLNFNGIEH